MPADLERAHRQQNEEIAGIAARVRQRLLRMHLDAGSGHFGGNLSCLDILTVLHHRVMTPEDRFVLSKGHSAGALYAVLWSKGLLREEELQKWCKDDTHLPGHPSGSSIPGVLFSTGSLGHGSSLALGLAMGEAFSNSGRHVYCLTSDGEWQEGSTWEALMLASHRQQPNLTTIIDLNGLQGFGTTEEVLSMGRLAHRIRAFDVPVIEVDGHNPEELARVLSEARDDGQYTVVCARTRKGLGTSLEGQLSSHYVPLPEVDHFQAAPRSEDGHA